MLVMTEHLSLVHMSYEWRLRSVYISQNVAWNEKINQDEDVIVEID